MFASLCIGMVCGSILGPFVPTGEDKDLGSERGNWIPAMRWFSRFGEALAVLPISWKSRRLFEDLHLHLQLFESIWVLGVPELLVVCSSHCNGREIRVSSTLYCRLRTVQDCSRLTRLDQPACVSDSHAASVELDSDRWVDGQAQQKCRFCMILYDFVTLWQARNIRIHSISFNQQQMWGFHTVSACCIFAPLFGTCQDPRNWLQPNCPCDAWQVWWAKLFLLTCCAHGMSYVAACGGSALGTAVCQGRVGTSLKPIRSYG